MKTEHAEFMAKLLVGINNANIPVIFGADFNTEPHTWPMMRFIEEATNNSFGSAYKLPEDKLKKALAAIDRVGREQWKDMNDEQKDNCSEYQKYKKTCLEMEPSTYKYRKGGDQPLKCYPCPKMIDHIFYSKEWQCEKRLLFPKDEHTHFLNPANAGLPSWKYPSDHFMAVADLTLTQDVQRTNNDAA